MNTDHIETPILTIEDKNYMRDAKGSLVPLELIKPQHKLEDEMVRKIHSFASDLSQQIMRFKGHCFEDMCDFDAMLSQEYDAKKGGAKGNKTYMSYDGLKKVSVQIADLVDFGSELQIAKTIIDECLNEWAEDARPEIRAIVTRAFNTDKKGQINRSELFMLLRLDIEDTRWRKAMSAIRDAMRIVGSKTYIRFYERASLEHSWQAITIDLAKVSS